MSSFFKVNILTKGMISANSVSFLLPLVKNKKNLYDDGLKIEFYKSVKKKFLIVIVLFWKVNFLSILGGVIN